MLVAYHGLWELLWKKHIQAIWGKIATKHSETRRWNTANRIKPGSWGFPFASLMLFFQVSSFWRPSWHRVVDRIAVETLVSAMSSKFLGERSKLVFEHTRKPCFRLEWFLMKTTTTVTIKSQGFQAGPTWIKGTQASASDPSAPVEVVKLPRRGTWRAWRIDWDVLRLDMGHRDMGWNTCSKRYSIL